jgi:glycolate oxidase iron-sulfur subunit
MPPTSMANTGTANIGCLTHLQSGSPIPLRHWFELLDSALAAP